MGVNACLSNGPLQQQQQHVLQFERIDATLLVANPKTNDRSADRFSCAVVVV